MSNRNNNPQRKLEYIAIKDENNKPTASLKFFNSTIEGNWAKQNLMQILLSELHISQCYLLDNYAH